MVAHVQHLRRRHAQAVAGGMEDAGLRLGRAMFARAQLEGEKMRQADPFQVGVAVAQRRHRHPRGDARQRLQCVGVAFDLIARGIEHFVGRLQQVQAGAAVLQRLLDRQPAQRTQVEVQLRVVAEGALAQFAHRRHRVHGSGGGAVLAHPFVQDHVDAGADRRERPQRVVEVEGDGLDWKFHPAILRLPAGAFIPAAAPSPACLPGAPAPA